jgi:hypothetical protein
VKKVWNSSIRLQVHAGSGSQVGVPRVQEEYNRVGDCHDIHPNQRFRVEVSIHHGGEEKQPSDARGKSPTIMIIQQGICLE